MVKNIVFDIGNVLIRFDPLAYLVEEYRDFNDVLTLYREVFLSEEWALLDKGAIDEDEAVRRIVRKIPDYEGEVSRIIRTWEYFLIEEIKASTYFLKLFKAKGYKVYALSNYPKRGYLYTEKNYDFFRLFDGKVISYEVGKLKPQAGIYEVFMEKYALKPEECLFIDDSLENVEAARNLGMKGVHFRQTSQFMEVLDFLETR